MVLYKAALFIALFLCWFIFSGYTESFFVISGIISCLIVMFIQEKLYRFTFYDIKYFNIFKLIISLLRLFKDIIKSAIKVSIKIWQITPDISPGMSLISTNHRNNLEITMYANSITLTPGTICVDSSSNTLLIHALCIKDLEELEKV